VTIPHEDLTVYFSGMDARLATWRPVAGGSVAVTVFFDAPHVLADMESGMTVGQPNPSAIGIESEFPAVAKGDQIDIGATAYRIDAVHPDGTGLVTLILKKA